MYQIVTDTSANLPWDYIRKHKIVIVPFTYTVNGVEASETRAGEFNGKAYYKAVREGATVVTSQVPPQRYVDILSPILAGGDDVLFVGMSSGISGSYQSSVIAAEELRETFPARRIRTVDTLAASMGEGLLVMRAVELRDAGADLDAAAETLEAARKNLCQLLMVDDLFYLKRTGRVSGASAVVGTVLGIKPILKGSPEGQLVVSAKVRGRKQAIQAMAERYAELATDKKQQTVAIAHADCALDASQLMHLVRKAGAPKDIVTVMYEPVTGGHTGPDALALFFFGDDDVREKY